MALGIGELIKPAQDALAPVGSTLSDVWQGVVGDRVAAWRLKNAAKLQSNIRKELQEAGLALNTSKIPERYAFAWFEEATKQDEPQLQVLFARLLVRAANGDEDALDRRHIGLLGQFTPADAEVFSVIFDPSKRQGTPQEIVPAPPSWNEDSLCYMLERALGEKTGASIEHLVNIGILRRSYKLRASEFAGTRRYVDLGDGGLDFPKPDATDFKIDARLLATTLGMSLYAAVKDDQRP